MGKSTPLVNTQPTQNRQVSISPKDSTVLQRDLAGLKELGCEPKFKEKYRFLYLGSNNPTNLYLLWANYLANNSA